jgi:hypothetical protein
VVAGSGDGGGLVGLDLAVQAGEQVQGDGGVIEAVGGGVASGQGCQGVGQNVGGVGVEGRADVVVAVRGGHSRIIVDTTCGCLRRSRAARTVLRTPLANSLLERDYIVWFGWRA